MEITVIGFHGGSAPADHATSSYLLKTDQVTVLLDCGAGTMSQLQKIMDIDEIDHVILTHYHYDHFSDAGAFVYNRLVKRMMNHDLKPLTFYTQKDDAISPTLLMEGGSQLEFIDEESRFSIGDLEFSFMVTKHPVKCLAVKVKQSEKTLVYTADSAFTQELVDFTQGADCLIAECSLYAGYSGEKSGHMNTNEVARLINETGVPRTVLTHLPIYGNHQDLLSSVKEATDNKEVVLAEKFLTINI